MSDHIDPGQKSDLAVIAATGLDGIAAGATEFIADEIATAFGRPARRRPRNRFRRAQSTGLDSRATHCEAS